MVYIAAEGWEHDGWRGTFYPPDLPADWRLDFYANEFKAVVVPWRSWRGVDERVFAHWRQSAGEGFTFFAELGPEKPGEIVLSRLAAGLGAGLGGLLVRGVALEGPMLETVRRAVPGVPVTKFGPEAAPVSAPDVGGCRVGPDGFPQCGGGPLRAFGCSGRDVKEPRRLRQVIESLGAGAGTDALLFFQGDPPDVEAMRAAEVVAELLVPPHRSASESGSD